MKIYVEFGNIQRTRIYKIYFFEYGTKTICLWQDYALPGFRRDKRDLSRMLDSGEAIEIRVPS